MNRFFIDKDSIGDSSASIMGQDANHIQRVLRLGLGDLIVVCDGEGTDYFATISHIDKGIVRLDLKDSFKSLGEPQTEVTLYQGIPKGSKMDLIIQKTVELGIKRIVPMVTSRTIVTLQDYNKAKKRIERWQRIAKESAKQSRRGIIPKVDMPMDYSKVVESSFHDSKLIFWEEEGVQGLSTYLRDRQYSKDLGILVGPEGGLDAEEVNLSKEYDWKVLSLGPRILRTETAGIAILSAIMCSMGEMG